MADCTIKTNWQARDVLSWFDLTDRERKEFDYRQSEDEQHSGMFVRYKGWTYDLGEFIRVKDDRVATPKGWEKFDGYSSDSFFSGVLVKFMDSHERVIMATYIC